MKQVSLPSAQQHYCPKELNLNKGHYIHTYTRNNVDLYHSTVKIRKACFQNKVGPMADCQPAAYTQVFRFYSTCKAFTNHLHNLVSLCKVKLNIIKYCITMTNSPFVKSNICRRSWRRCGKNYKKSRRKLLEVRLLCTLRKSKNIALVLNTSFSSSLSQPLFRSCKREAHSSAQRQV